MKVKNKRAFTIVELLCIIVILGVLTTLAIVASYNLINKANEVHNTKQEDIVIMATKDYLQNDSTIAPKIVGESTNVKIQTLKDNKYLKEDVKNSSGESCMKNSYVRIYKLTDTEYSYLAYIYCGNEKVPKTEEIPTPTIEVTYTDSKNKIVEIDKINNLKDLKFNIKLDGGTTKTNTQIELNTYSYKILVSNENDEYTEVYNSNSINAGNKTGIIITKELKEYLKDIKPSKIKIKIKATNKVGGVLEQTSYLQNN